MRTTTLICVALFSMIQLLIGCGGGSHILQESHDISRHHVIDKYLIGVDDIVQVNVWRNPELSVSVPVRPDGKISVPLLGDVEAGGKTPEQVATLISQNLVTFVRDPQVTVILTQLNSHEYISRVRITGAVQAQRSLPFRQGMTVLDVVLESGGPSVFASSDDSKLFRREADGNMHRYDIHLDEILTQGELSTNYRLIPGDVISVPERAF